MTLWKRTAIYLAALPVIALAVIGTYALALPLAFPLVALYSLGISELAGARGIWEALETLRPGVRGLVLVGGSSVITLFVAACLLGATYFLTSREPKEQGSTIAYAMRKSLESARNEPVIKTSEHTGNRRNQSPAG